MAFNKTSHAFIQERIADGVQPGDRAIVDVFRFLSDVEYHGIQEMRDRLGPEGWAQALELAVRYGVRLLE